ncbi:MAG: phage tail tape measure protein [Methylobacter sp.]|nr:phage tail tape measure protein [Methylobacter sp.]
MAKDFQLKALLVAVDKISPTLKGITKNLNTFKRQLNTIGKGAPVLASGFTAALAVPAKALMDLENASTNLQNTLMSKDGGIPAVFDKINEQTIKLGNQLPGTTADFANMASTLKSLGVEPEKIADGALKATAYLAVVGKEVGVTYENSAEAIGKLSRAFGIASNDLVPFTDSIQRALFMGIKLDDLQYAMARVSGPLKAMGKQGLSVAQDLVPLVSVLTGTGISGEEAGTGLKKIIEVAAMKGKFKDISTLVKDLDKINKLPGMQRIAKLKDLFGEEHASKAALITLESYNKALDQMTNQGSLVQKIGNSDETLSNKMESAGGTWTNAMAAFAKNYAPQLKQIADSVNKLSENLTGFINQNGLAVMTALKMAGAFVGLKLAARGLAGGIGLLTAAMKTNPLVLLAQAAIVAAPLIIDNWGAITAFLKDNFAKATDWITGKFNTFTSGIMLGIDAAGEVFKSLLPDAVLDLFTGVLDKISARFTAFVDFIRSSISSIGDAASAFFGETPNGMRPPSYVAPLAKQAESVKVPLVAKNIPAMPILSVIQGSGTVQSLKQMQQSPVTKAAESMQKVPAVKSMDSMQKAPIIKNLYSEQQAPALKRYSDIGEMGIVNQSIDNSSRSNVQLMQQPTQRKSIIQSAMRGGVDVKVDFVNAPRGLRVEPAKTRGPVRAEQNVGYRSLGMAGAQ